MPIIETWKCESCDEDFKKGDRKNGDDRCYELEEFGWVLEAKLAGVYCSTKCLKLAVDKHLEQLEPPEGDESIDLGTPEKPLFGPGVPEPEGVHMAGEVSLLTLKVKAACGITLSLGVACTRGAQDVTCEKCLEAMRPELQVCHMADPSAGDPLIAECGELLGPLYTKRNVWAVTCSECKDVMGMPAYEPPRERRG